MSRAAFARLTPDDRERIRVAFVQDQATRKRRVVVVVVSAALAVAAIGVTFATLGAGGLVLGAIVAGGLLFLANLYVRVERDRLFQQGFAGSGLSAEERASVLHMLRTDPDYADERDA